MYQTFGPKKKKSALSENANTIYFDNLFTWQVGGIVTKINHDKSCRPTPIISRELSGTKINHDKSCSPTPIISRELSDGKRDKHITFILLYIDISLGHNTIIDTLLLLEKN